MRPPIARVFVVIVVAVFSACTNPASPPESLVAPAIKGPTAKEVYELREKCAKDAMAWFKLNYSQPQDDIPVKGGGYVSSLPPTYENHYSQAQNGCFAALSQTTSFKFGAKSNREDLIIQSNTLWDVNQNSQMGVFVVKNFTEVTACNVLGTKCANKEQWTGLARIYISE